jgi:ABC-2 type transport system permease protein
MFKCCLATQLEYRARFWLWVVIELVTLSFAIFVWSAIYRENRLVGGYSFEQMVLYYALVPVVSNFVYVHVLTDYLAKRIKDGEISGEMIRPYNLSMAYFLRSTAIKVFQMVVKLPLFVISLGVIVFYLKAGLDWSNLVLGIGVCLPIYLMNFLMDLTIAFAAFWFESVWSLTHLKRIMTMVFGGLAFPLALVPAGWQGVFEVLPLRFLYNFPINVFLGRITSKEMVGGMITVVGWIVVFGIASQWLWRRGVKKFAACGG